MPDDSSGKEIKQKTVQDGLHSKAVPTPPPPDNPPAAPAESVSDKHMTAEVKDLEDRIRGAEKWMIWLTGAIAFFGLCTVIVAFLQWSAMRGQLSEMKSSGVDTHDLAVKTKDLADRMKDQADRTKVIAEQAIIQAQAAKELADATFKQMKGTQAAIMEAFTVRVQNDSRGMVVTLSGYNVGHIYALKLAASLSIAVRDWPSRKTVFGPIMHRVLSRPISNINSFQDPTTIERGIIDRFIVPGISQENLRSIQNGKQFIAVEWNASYDNGLGDTVYKFPGKRSMCEAYVDLGTTIGRCQERIMKGPAPCEDVDSLMETASEEKRQTEKRCAN